MFIAYVWMYTVRPTWTAHVGPMKIILVARVGPKKNSLYTWKTSKFNVGLLWAMYGHI